MVFVLVFFNFSGRNSKRILKRFPQPFYFSGRNSKYIGELEILVSKQKVDTADHVPSVIFFEYPTQLVQIIYEVTPEVTNSRLQMDL